MENRRRVIKIILNILVPLGEIGLICFLGPKLLSFFMPFVIGWIVSMLANPLVAFFEKHLKLVRRHSSVLIVVLALGAVIGGLYLISTQLLAELADLVADLPGIFEAVRAELVAAGESIGRMMARMPQPLQDSYREFSENLGRLAGELVSTIAFPTVTVAGNVAKSIPALLVNTIVMILSAYFFIVERERILEVIRRFLPQGVSDYLNYFKRDVRRLVGGYFLAQFRIMFVVGVILGIGFLILGVPYAGFLAVLIALLDFLPMFGTGTALLPWALVKLLSGEPAFAAGLLLLYVLTQVLRQIIQPKIVGDSLGLSPFMTLFFLYLGFKLHGLSGMILAVPVGIVLLNLFQYGAFDGLLTNLRLLWAEVEHFRREP